MTSHVTSHPSRLGQSEAAALGHNMDIYRARMEAFGWHAIVVDGHDIESLCRAFYDATTVKGKPTCLVAKTFKGENCDCGVVIIHFTCVNLQP